MVSYILILENFGNLFSEVDVFGWFDLFGMFNEIVD